MKLKEALLVIAAVLALGVLDHGTGYDLSTFIFYFIPVAVVAARHGVRVAYAVSLLCAATWFVVDSRVHPYPQAWMGVWNGAARLTAFAWIAYLVSRIRTLLAATQQEVQTLQGFLPICAQCKKIRNDQGYWQHLETYLAQHAPVTFSHGLCDECAAALKQELAGMRRPGERGRAADRGPTPGRPTRAGPGEVGT